jgi:hypothetical protein
MAMIKVDIVDNLGVSQSQVSDLRMRADLLDAILRITQNKPARK